MSVLNCDIKRALNLPCIGSMKKFYNLFLRVVSHVKVLCMATQEYCLVVLIDNYRYTVVLLSANNN